MPGSQSGFGREREFEEAYFPMSTNSHRLVCFDVDGTLVGQTIFVWQTLHDYFGTDPVLRKQAYDDYMAGRITYADWFEWDIRLLSEKGLNRGRMLDAIDGLVLMEGVYDVLETLRGRGFILAIVSGSLNIVLERFDLSRFFDDILINELFFDDAGELIDRRPTPFDLENKAAGLDWLIEKHGLERRQTVFVGDNFNDLSIARSADISIAFNSSCDELIEASTVHVDGTDLRAILPHIIG